MSSLSSVSITYMFFPLWLTDCFCMYCTVMIRGLYLSLQCASLGHCLIAPPFQALVMLLITLSRHIGSIMWDTTPFPLTTSVLISHASFLS